VRVPAVEMVGVTKRFGSVVACDRVSLSVREGEIHGLLGQNGAGKTTLMKILLGLVRPDAGRVLVRGHEVEIRDPRTAADLGIAMVQQHFSLVPAMRVWENVVLGAGGRLDRSAARGRIQEVARRYGLAVDPDARVEDLTTGERQRVEIVKCLWRDPALLILDEPTSVLTPAESRELFSVLRRVASHERRSVILISHKLDEIRHATDRVTVMRSGRVVARRATPGMDVADLAREMIGREPGTRAAAAAVGAMDAVVSPSPGEPERPGRTADADRGMEPGRPGPAAEPDHTGVFDRAATDRAEDLGRAGEPGPATRPRPAEPEEEPGDTLEFGRVADSGPAGDPGPAAVDEAEVLLRVRDAYATAPDGRPLLRGLSLHVRAGEILGIAGVEGNGQAALADLLSSLIELDAGVVEVCGRPVPTGKAGAMHRAGVGVVPEDRHRSGCVLDMSVAENLVLADVGRVAAGGLVRPRRLREHAARLIEEFEIVVTDPDAPLRRLSGGNQQKVVLARELSANPRVLVAAQPSRGLDVAAAEYVAERIRRAARDGIAVLLISSDLEEILALAHRVAVIHRGAIAGEMPRAEADVARLALLMGGRAA
jgi:ABC-type uncharacterized transport system ATPase subunit